MIRKTGTSSSRQLAPIWSVSCGMELVGLALSSWRLGSVSSSFTAVLRAGRSVGRTRPGASTSRTVALPCSLDGALAKVAAAVNIASQGGGLRRHFAFSKMKSAHSAFSQYAAPSCGPDGTAYSPVTVRRPYPEAVAIVSPGRTWLSRA